MAKTRKRIVLIGNRLEAQIEQVREAFQAKDKKAVRALALEQIQSDVNYLNINVGSEPEDAEIMKWVVKEVQDVGKNIPLFLNSDNRDVIEAGLKVYDRQKSIPIVNSADAGNRSDFINLAADYEAGVVCLCKKNDLPMERSERILYCNEMLEKGMGLGINPDDMYFDPVAVPLKDEQEWLPEVLETIRQIKKLGLNSVVGISNVSIGLIDEVKETVESAFAAMCMAKGAKALLINPFSSQLMGTILAGGYILNNRLFTPAELKKYTK